MDRSEKQLDLRVMLHFGEKSVLTGRGFYAHLNKKTYFFIHLYHEEIQPE